MRVESSFSARAPLFLAVSSLLLFLLSAHCGVLVAYDRTLALEKLVALLISMGAAVAIVWMGGVYWRALLPIALGFALVIVVANLPHGRAALIDLLGEPVAIVLPLCAGWIASFDPRGRLATNPLLAGICAALLVVVVLFFVVAGDFSSGIALLAALAVMALLIIEQKGDLWRPESSRQINRLLLTIVVLLGCLYVWSITSPTASTWITRLAPATVSQRWQRYQDFLQIIADYPFSGSGLGVSAMVYSSYLYLVQVPFLTQAHNLYLQIAVEQGIVGLIGFCGVILATVWGLRQTLLWSVSQDESRSSICLLAIGTSGAVTAIIVNGLLDGDLYSGPFVMFLFVPLGVAWALYFAAIPQRLLPQESYRQYQLSGQGSGRSSGFWQGAALWLTVLAPFLLVIAAFFMAGGLAMLYANAGTVAQSQAELAAYQWPQMPLQDMVRRNDAQQLNLAERFYNSALALNPDNVTAQWRLGEIDLAQGHYSAAEERLAQAYALAPERRAVRQLLGEIYAIQGKAGQAVQLWLPLDLSQNQLQLRAWWYQIIGDSTRARNFQEALHDYEQRVCCP